MCGDCARLPLATCSCDWAATQRERVRRRLARGDEPQAIVNDYVQRHGAAALTVPPDRGHNKALYLVPVVALVAGAGLVVYLARKWARVGEAPAPTPESAEPRAQRAKPDRDAYDARLDEELRGNDE